MATRNKMSMQERAKQFLPFAALKGFEKALREKEEEMGEFTQNSKTEVPSLRYYEEERGDFDEQ